MYDTPASDEYTWSACSSCFRELRHEEAGRYACRICRDRAEQHLNALPGRNGLYAALADALVPGSTSGEGRVSQNRTAPLPLKLAPLSLSARGGVVTILQTWLIDWHELLGWTHPRWEGDLQGQLDQVVRALRNNLDWAAAEHPAFAEFASEVAGLVRSCRLQVTGERPERRITVMCTCGGPLKITVSTPGTRCTGCGAQYDRTAALELPLADRATAA